MNPAKLRAALEKNKTTIGVAGAALVGGLALLQARKKDGGSAAPAAPAGRPSLSSGGAPVYGSPAGYTYDSSSSDVYNAIQPQLEALQRMVERQTEKATPIPVPEAPTPMSNAQWLRQATEGWVRSGQGRQALDIQNALTTYLAGRPVGTNVTPAIQWTINEYGAAPEGTQGVSPVFQA